MVKLYTVALVFCWSKGTSPSPLQSKGVSLFSVQRFIAGASRWNYTFTRKFLHGFLIQKKQAAILFWTLQLLFWKFLSKNVAILSTFLCLLFLNSAPKASVHVLNRFVHFTCFKSNFWNFCHVYKKLFFACLPSDTNSVLKWWCHYDETLSSKCPKCTIIRIGPSNSPNLPIQKQKVVLVPGRLQSTFWVFILVYPKRTDFVCFNEQTCFKQRFSLEKAKLCIWFGSIFSKLTSI